MDLFDFSLKLPITDPTWIFLLVLLIILFAPILLNRLRIPHIIGMILAGLVIGEHGFNILARDSSFELFGKVGLYYIMFLAGLEMNMSDFKQNRGKAVMLGLLAFIIPIMILMHKPANDPIFTFIEKKRGEGKSGKLAMVAGLNKFLRVYYGKVTELYRSLPAIK